MQNLIRNRLSIISIPKFHVFIQKNEKNRFFDKFECQVFFTNFNFSPNICSISALNFTPLQRGKNLTSNKLKKIICHYTRTLSNKPLKFDKKLEFPVTYSLQILRFTLNHILLKIFGQFLP